MPNPGDQHRENRHTVNPYAEVQPSISSYTAREIATLSAKLDKQLGPEYISTRPGAGGGKVHYLAAEKVIQLANEIFGFNGWSSQIQNVQVDFVDENPTNGKITLGLSTIVRVTLKDGAFHEDIGYGHIENCKGKAAAFEKAKKEATTDALKRALRNFGNVLGNCLYDKDYLGRVAKIKLPPSRWDGERLHRHPDYAPVKQEARESAIHHKDATAADSNTTTTASFGSGEFEEEFGGGSFDESDFTHGDEMRVDDAGVDAPKMAVARQPTVPNHSLQHIPSAPHLRPPNGIPRGPSPGPKAMIAGRPSAASHPSANPLQQTPQQRSQPQPPNNSEGLRSNPSSGSTAIDSPIQVSHGPSVQPVREGMMEVDGQPFPGAPLPINPPAEALPGFVSGRVAGPEPLSEIRPPPGNGEFNLHAESPSIRRTTGIHGGKSGPVKRTQIMAMGATVPAGPTAASAGLGSTPIRTDFVNPSADASRRVGMPATPGGMGNRGPYRPPSTIGTKRPPLSDVTNHQTPGETTETKRQKTEGAAAVTEEHAMVRS